MVVGRLSTEQTISVNFDQYKVAKLPVENVHFSFLSFVVGPKLFEWIDLGFQSFSCPMNSIGYEDDFQPK